MSAKKTTLWAIAKAIARESHEWWRDPRSARERFLLHNRRTGAFYEYRCDSNKRHTLSRVELRPMGGGA